MVWKTMTDAQKEPYEYNAMAEKRYYEHDLEDWQESDEGKAYAEQVKRIATAVTVAKKRVQAHAHNRTEGNQPVTKQRKLTD